MQSLTFEIGNYRGRLAGFCVRGFMLAALIAFGALLADRPATAGSCGAMTGKALYDCLAPTLEHKADMVGRGRGDPGAPGAGRAVQSAPSRLRSATRQG